MKCMAGICPPRGESTGEDTPVGQSLRARMLVLDVAAHDVAVRPSAARTIPISRMGRFEPLEYEKPGCGRELRDVRLTA